MNRYKAYPDYKDSGVEWLGPIPIHWEILQSRRMFAVRSEPALSSDKMLTASQKYGVLYQSDFVEQEGRRVVEVILGVENLKHVEPNDFIISMRSFQGGIEWCTLRGSTSFHYVILKPLKNIVPRFFAHLFKSLPYIHALRRTSDLIRDGQELRFSNFVLVSLPLIPDDEQEKIADFLDHETAKIDALIEKQQRLIELLKEKRQAVISHAVTKGLNPNAPMKDSGVEWLGEVPAHWSLPKIKWFFRTESGGTPNTAKHDEYYLDGTIPWIRTTDLTNDELYETPIKITKKAVVDSACALLPINSVLVAMYGGAGSIGKHALLKFQSTINQAVCAILPNSKIRPEFLHLYVEFYRPYWMVGAEGTRKDPNINQDVIRELIVPCPSDDEQRKIVETTKVGLSKVDSTIKRCENNIELMQERRTALISAAVTGKIDVRDWQAAA